MRRKILMILKAARECNRPAKDAKLAVEKKAHMEKATF
jgi:hypothetical protein